LLLKDPKDGILVQLASRVPAGSQIYITGHSQGADELRRRINRTEVANGFANRFLFPLIKRSKELPFGGELTDSEILRLGNLLQRVVECAKSIGRVRMTDAAKVTWKSVYSDLSAAQSGLLGAITARAEAQVVRLALIYAVLDCPAKGEAQIDVEHLKAALAIWEYCEGSAARIFGDILGDPMADEILRALRQAGAEGMTRTALRNLFGRHQSGARIEAALGLLVARGRARMQTRKTAGSPAEEWFAVGGA